jgi:chromate transport protein ChrA
MLLFVKCNILAWGGGEGVTPDVEEETQDYL